jgi:hypothetical protein
MRNNISIVSLDKSLKNIIESVELENISLRTHVVDNPNFRRDYTTDVYYSKKLNDLIRLVIYSQYTKDEITSVYIKEFCIRESRKPQNFVLRFFLKTKAEMLLFLKDTNLWHTREFFGLVSEKKLLQSLKSIGFKKKKTFVRKTKRKRGYDDKGNLRKNHQRLPRYDVSLDELHREIKRKYQSIEDTFNFLEGFIL